ncbi:MAG: dipeptide epimerase [Gemmatimonadaceae bacterium]
MKLTHDIYRLRTKHAFTIARGGSSEYQTVRAVITDGDGVEGWGEAAATGYYGETPETVIAAFARFAPILERANQWSLEAVEAELDDAIGHNGSAKSAVSAALHDLAGKKLGVPVFRLWGLDPARAPISSFTIGIGDETELRGKVGEAVEYPILKVKLGTDRDEEIIRVVRDAAPGKTLRVDANTGWSPKLAINRIAMLVDYGVEFVEQPLPPEDLEGLRYVRERSSLPIIADESCVTASDIPRLLGAFDGINIKLAKCGGLREALRMIAVARAHGLLVMMGCMIETSLGISAAAHMAALLDFADLDGAALVGNDPFRGATIGSGRIQVPNSPGLGVALA